MQTPKRYHAVNEAAYTALGPHGDSGCLKAFCYSNTEYCALFWLSDEPDADLMLGHFETEVALRNRIERFIRDPVVTPALALKITQAQAIRNEQHLAELPPFHGIFGTAFSGYLLKPDTEPGSEKLMLFYTADYRSELLGVFNQAEATRVMTEHYDQRRRQCLLC